jgi:DnaJ-class molecular chaperone
MAGEPQINGRSIQCVSCSGHGIKAAWQFGVLEPDECSMCGGSGRNWQYPGGAVAKYYSGPLVGRAALKAGD